LFFILKDLGVKQKISEIWRKKNSFFLYYLIGRLQYGQKYVSPLKLKASFSYVYTFVLISATGVQQNCCNNIQVVFKLQFIGLVIFLKKLFFEKLRLIIPLK